MMLFLLLQALLFALRPCSVAGKGSYHSYSSAGRRLVSPGWYRSRTYSNYESSGLRNTQLFRWLWCWAVKDDDCKSAEPFLVSVEEGSLPLATGQTTVRLTLYDESSDGQMIPITSAKTSTEHSVFLSFQTPRWEQHLAVGWPDITAATVLDGDKVMLQVEVEQAGGWWWFSEPDKLGVGCISLNTLRTAPNKYMVRLYEKQTDSAPSTVCDISRRESARVDVDSSIAWISGPWVIIEVSGFSGHADSDGDGILDQHEIRDWIGETEHGQPLSQDNLQAAQHRAREYLDLDQDGTMGAEEVARLVSSDTSVLDEVLDEEGGAASIGNDVFGDRGIGDDSFLGDDGSLVADSFPDSTMRESVGASVLATTLVAGVLCVAAFALKSRSNSCYQMRPLPGSKHPATTAAERYHRALTTNCAKLPVLRGQPPNVRSVVNGDVTSISHCVAPDHRGSIHVLQLPSNDIRSVAGLQDFTQLLQLDLSSNDVTTLDGIECATALIMLDVSNNDLCGQDAFKPLMQCVALEWLDVANNDLISLGAGLPSSLRYLNASSNDLTDLNGVLELHRLECLDLSNNCLRDLVPNDFVGRLPALRSVAFARNDLQGPNATEAVATIVRGGTIESSRHQTWPSASTTLRSRNTSWNQRLLWIGLHGNSFSLQEMEAIKRALLRCDRPDLAESAFLEV